MTVSVEVRITLHVENITATELEIQTGQLMQALLDLEDGRLDSTSVSADLGEFLVEVEIVSHADTFEEAAAWADASIRTAIHDIGGSTPDWNTTYQQAELVTA